MANTLAKDGQARVGVLAEVEKLIKTKADLKPRIEDVVHLHRVYDAP